MKIITISNAKGGTGKTTTALALAQAAAHEGKRVLLIDLEPQGNSTFTLQASTSGITVYDVMAEGVNAAEAIQQTNIDNLDVMAAGWSLSTLTTNRGSARRLANALEAIKSNYSYIVIDTPPTAGELLYNAMQAATHLVIPVNPDAFSMQGIYQIYDTAEQIKTSNPNLKHIGVVINMSSGRANLTRTAKEVIASECKKLGIKVYGEIPTGIAIQEAQAARVSLFDHAPKSKPARAYMDVFHTIAKTK